MFPLFRSLRFRMLSDLLRPLPVILKLTSSLLAYGHDLLSSQAERKAVESTSTKSATRPPPAPFSETKRKLALFFE